MIPVTLTTESLPVVQQFETWRASYASVFHMERDRADQEGFLAATDAWTFDGVALSRTVTPALGITRSHALIRRSPVDHWCITIAKSSTASHEVKGKAVAVPAKVPFVYSLGQEMHSERIDDRLQIYLARDRFSALVPVLDGALGKAFDSPTGHLLADYLMTIERNMLVLAVLDGPRLSAAIEAMVRACLAPSAGSLAQARSHIDSTLMEKVRRVVVRHLRSPSLGTDMVCREVGVSRSRLYRLMAGERGVAHYIQRRRLTEAYSILSDAAHDVSIGKIADMLCFPDASSFSRAFRREFGISAKDVKGNAPVTTSPTVPGNAGLTTGSFAEYLTNL